MPYADLFNHNPFANSYIDARQQGFFTKTDEVVVYADRSYKKMEQVCPCYVRVRVCVSPPPSGDVTLSRCEMWGLGVARGHQSTEWAIIELSAIAQSMTWEDT